MHPSLLSYSHGTESLTNTENEYQTSRVAAAAFLKHGSKFLVCKNYLEKLEMEAGEAP